MAEEMSDVRGAMGLVAGMAGVAAANRELERAVRIVRANAGTMPSMALPGAT